MKKPTGLAAWAAVVGPFLLSTVNAEVWIHNGHAVPIYVWQADAGGRCNYGPDGRCDEPMVLTPGCSESIPWSPEKLGTTIKISDRGVLNHETPILEFEYTVDNGGVSVDVSLINGGGAANLARPIPEATVRWHPEGNGSESCNGGTSTCPPHTPCPDAYLFDNDNEKMKTCTTLPEHYHIIFE